MSELIALIEDDVVGTLFHSNGKTSLHYHQEWLDNPDAYPLSLSMPISAADHPNSAVDPFLWGLLPDNELVLDRWARKFQVSARNAFRLIAHVGEDCPGAVQFLPPERLAGLNDSEKPEISWLTPAGLAERMRILRDDAAAGRIARDTGQFSLAGAQPKTALLRKGRRWGIPSGRTPTSHILKPATREFDGHAENEHLCLAAANDLGLIAAKSEVRQFGEVSVIVVERYDRFGEGTELLRIHQEDMCQALRIHPARKYQNDGGPGAREIVALLRASVHQPREEDPDSDDAPTEDPAEIDVWRFLHALVFNWLIGGTDAHAKNYSVLIGSRGLVRLAPLYDLASIFAYPDVDPRRAKLAMRISDKYRIGEIHLRHWDRMAAELRVEPQELVASVRSFAEDLPDTLSDRAAAMRKQGIDHPAMRHLVDGVARHAAAILRM
ncbi:MAG TPA: type II toxin-antitoxin system HipA family toxin [Allosphingosinicella sp.]|nr:type II toxin-antitoxin system HipA family toxin [Allosphingosinicella sp.]